MEEWKDVEGFEGLYQISDMGRLKSFKKYKDGYVLSNKNKTGWYLSVVLRNGMARKSMKIHKLVAIAFIPNPDNKPEINHKDGKKQNNKAENLEWATKKENISHAIKMHPNMLKGMNDYNKYIRPKVVEQYSLDGKFIAKYLNCKIASETTGVCQRNIFGVASKEEYKPGLTRKQAGGYVWKFAKERKKHNAS